MTEKPREIFASGGDVDGSRRGRSPSGRSGGGGSPERPLPLVVCQAYGILTGDESPSWPEFGTAYFETFHPHVSTVNTDYFELPLPRLAAVRNTGRSRRLVRRIRTAAQYLVELRETPAEVAFVAHSNGAVLALQACRELIASGVAVRSLVLIAPALRTRDASREIGGWLASGMLGTAMLVRPTKDAVIGAVGRSWRTKLAAWPWGSLGVDGWSLDDLGCEPSGACNAWTVDLPDMGHSDPVAPRNRRWLYEAIVAPSLLLAHWGELEPKGATA